MGDRLTHAQYRESARFATSLPGIKARAERVEPARRFCVHCHAALPLPGYTAITPPYPEDDGNRNTYEALLDVQACFAARLGRANYVPSPPTCLHMTACDLVSKKSDTVGLAGRRDDFVQAVRTCLRGLALSGARPSPLRLEVAGLTLFPKCVVALIGVPRRGPYERLCKLRDALCGDLADFGVRPQEPFGFHITLAYVETCLAPEERAALAECLDELNRRHFAPPLRFEVASVELRRFDDMSAFYRGDADWPRFSF